MIKKILLLSVYLLLLIGGSTLAQQIAPGAPNPQADGRGALSIFFDGENTLGVLPENVTRENMSRYHLREPRGVAIIKVVEGSPAERAGLKKDDVILRFDGEPMTSVRKLQRLINEAEPEHTARLIISRDGVEQEVAVTLGKRQDLPRTFGGIVLPPGNELRQRAEEMRKQGEEMRRLMEVMPRGDGLFSMNLGTGRRIGVTTAPLTEQLADYFRVTERRGLLITSVVENSPAAKAGLRAGDVITEGDSTQIKTLGDLSRALNSKDAGEITLTIIRDKKHRTIKVMPERRQGFSFDLPETLMMPPIATYTLPRRQVHIAPLKLTPLVLPPLRINSSRLPLRVL